MKKIALSLLLFFVMASLLISCSPEPGKSNPFEGRWKCDLMIAYNIIEFKADGSFSSTAYWSDGSPFSSYNGEYSFTDSILTMEGEDPCAYEFKDGLLSMVFPDETELLYFRID